MSTRSAAGTRSAGLCLWIHRECDIAFGRNCMSENALKQALSVLFRHPARSPSCCGVIRSSWRWHPAWRETLVQPQLGVCLCLAGLQARIEALNKPSDLALRHLSRSLWLQEMTAVFSTVLSAVLDLMAGCHVPVRSSLVIKQHRLWQVGCMGEGATDGG